MPLCYAGYGNLFSDVPGKRRWSACSGIGGGGGGGG